MPREVRKGRPVSDYREFPAPLPLTEYLVCLWTQTIASSSSQFAQRVLPDGCVDIVNINDETPMVIGPWTEPFVARLAPGTTITGARCRAGLAQSLLGLPASALLNQSVPVSAVWDSAATVRFERIADERSLVARRSAMEAALLARLSRADGVDGSCISSDRARLHRSEGENSATLGRPFWPKSVKHVLGTFCKGSLRTVQRESGAGDGNRTHVRAFGSWQYSVPLRSACRKLKTGERDEGVSS
jgi:hypothetical protein